MWDNFSFSLYLKKEFPRLNLITLALCLCLGIVIGKYTGISLKYIVSLILSLAVPIIFIALILLEKPLEKYIKISLFLLVILLGIIRIAYPNYLIYQAKEISYGDEIQGKGTIKEIKVYEGNGIYGDSIKVTLKNADIKLSGNTNTVVYISCNKETDSGEYIKDMGLKKGAVISFTGTYKEIKGPRNKGQFNSKSYYESKRIFVNIKSKESDVSLLKEPGYIDSCLNNINEKIKTMVLDNLPDNEAKVLLACLFGEKDSLNEDTLLDFQSTGIAHLLSISGTHSMLILGLSEFIFKSSGKKTGKIFNNIIPLFILVTYMALANFPISCVRTLIMIVYKRGNRNSTPKDCVSFSLMTCLLIKPEMLFNISFQLSFGVSAGIVILSPLVESYIRPRNKVQKIIAKYLLPPITAQISTTPLSLYWFNSLIPFGFIVNLFAVNLMPFLLVSLFCSLLCEILFSPVASLFWNVSGFFSLILIKIVDFFSSINHFQIYLKSGSFIFFLIPLGIMIHLSFLKRQYYLLEQKIKYVNWNKWKDFYKDKKAGKEVTLPKYISQKNILVISVSVFVISLFLFYKPYFHIYFLDVAQGDSIFIQSDNGMNILVDGGSSTITEVGKNRIIPFLKSEGVNTLDYVILTHEDYDHISGICEVINTISVKSILVNEAFFYSDNETVQEILNIAEMQNIKIRSIYNGISIKDGELNMEVILPLKGNISEGDNDSSIVIYLKHKDFKALLTGDMTSKGEEYILRNKVIGEIDVLKVAHHGSKYSSTKAFINAIKPKISYLSYGENNIYGHPHQAVVNNLVNVNSKIYRSAINGGILIKYHFNEIKSYPFVVE